MAELFSQYLEHRVEGTILLEDLDMVIWSLDHAVMHSIQEPKLEIDLEDRVAYQMDFVSSYRTEYFRGIYIKPLGDDVVSPDFRSEKRSEPLLHPTICFSVPDREMVEDIDSCFDITIEFTSAGKEYMIKFGYWRYGTDYFTIEEDGDGIGNGMTIGTRYQFDLHAGNGVRGAIHDFINALFPNFFPDGHIPYSLNELNYLIATHFGSNGHDDMSFAEAAVAYEGKRAFPMTQPSDETVNELFESLRRIIVPLDIYIDVNMYQLWVYGTRSDIILQGHAAAYVDKMIKRIGAHSCLSKDQMVSALIQECQKSKVFIPPGRRVEAWIKGNNI